MKRGGVEYETCADFCESCYLSYNMLHPHELFWEVSHKGTHDDVQRKWGIGSTGLKVEHMIKSVLDAETLERIKSSSSSLECPMCLCDYEEGDVILKVPTCNHQYHEGCITPWISKQREGTCPVCPKYIRKKEAPCG